jgi:hypothetical protein
MSKQSQPCDAFGCIHLPGHHADCPLATRDPGAIGPLIEELTALQSHGVTHVHARDSRGNVQLVTGITGERISWNDGRNLSVVLKTENFPRPF